MSVASARGDAALGFTATSGHLGECSRIGPHLYRFMLEELLYKNGFFAGRLLLDLTIKHDRNTDTIEGVSGQSRMKFTVFRTTPPPPPPPAPCINSTAELPAGDMVREDENEHVCRSADDIELTGRRIDTDSFFTP
ncbi:MAG: hypothetical protein IPK66_14155 [Rhodospirillales bacterium]|nr:hypothetical protein [Rhodospirillales bacterium]